MARLDVNIVTSMVGAGLEREALLLKDLFASHDIYSNLMHYTNFGAPMIRADITIFFEVVMPQALSLSRENWLVPNCEWWDARNDRFLPHFSKVLCKTQDCYRVWCAKVGPQKCVYTSFEARDLYNPEIPRELKILHIAGKSEHKNTDAVLNTWNMTHLPHVHPLPMLTVVCRAPAFNHYFEPSMQFIDENVTRYDRVSEEQLVQLLNSHQIHLMPSQYEGFGHILHEGLGCGALMITTDAPPMNQFEGIYKAIRVSQTCPRSLVNLNIVHHTEVEKIVREAVTLFWGNKKEVAARSMIAREAFLRNREFFRKTMMELVNNVKH